MAARFSGDALLVVGDPSYRFATAADGSVYAADTTLGGIFVAESGPPLVFSRPAGARAFFHPRILPRTPGVFEVVWSERDFDPVAARGTEPQLLRHGTLVNGVWRNVRQVGRFDSSASLSREMGSDLVTVAGTSYLAFPFEIPASAAARIGLLSDSGARWSVAELDFGMRLIGSTELGDDVGTLAMIFLATPNELPADGRSLRSTAWVSWREPTGWTVPTRVGGDGSNPSKTPKLVTSAGSLIAAWIIDDGEPTLEWREVMRGRAPGAVQRLGGIVTMTQGQAPFRDVLSLVTSSGESRIVRLRRDGYDEFARRSLAAPMAPLVTGSLERPLLLTVEQVARPDPGPFRLVAYDLHCALHR